jgi:hypothetical protein
LPLSIGDNVRDIRGRPLGKVDGLSVRGFKLTDPSGSLWLSFDAAFTHEENELTLVCNGNRIGDYALGPTGQAKEAR